MIDKNGIRAFSDDRYDYYKLNEDIGHYESDCGTGCMLPKGTIFVHDTDDSEIGSIARGCLKNCWTPDGNTYSNLGANTIFLHAAAIHTDMFSLVKPKKSKSEKTIEKMKEQLKDIMQKLDDIL